MRIRDFNPPPTYTDLFYRWIGIPRSTGFDIYVGDYPYGVGLSVGKRMRYRFPSRQGLTGKLITPSQTTQRQHFRAALDIWNLQPTYTPLNSPYGAKGRNWWREQSSGLGFFTINYVMSLQLPHEIADTPSPWDPDYWVTIAGGGAGDVEGYQETQARDAGTYRVELIESDWKCPPWAHPYFLAVTIYIRRTDESLTFIGPIGDTNPTGVFEYSPPALMYDSPAAAYAGYLNDSIHVTRDIVLADGEALALQYRNYRAGGGPTHEVFLTAKITEVP